MSKFIPKSQSFANAHHAADNMKLETTAEKSIGKEINVVNGKDFNHLDLIIEAKNNRLKSEFFYIYDYDKFNNCSLLKENFNVLAANQINHNSARYVIHYLTMELKRRFKEIKSNSKASKQEQNMIYDIFKPSLGQFDESDLSEANDFIRSLFPYEGCSFTGEKLEKLIGKSTWITLILSLRIIWSLLPKAIIPWTSFHKFETHEQKSNFSNKQSFYQVLPTYLPSHNHSCVLFEFLEILLYIFADNYFLDLNVAIDLIFTAGQICFNRDEFKPSNNQNDDDLNELQRFYYKRGYSFYQIFVSYLRSLSEEPTFGHKTLLELFKIDEYPPKPYKPVTQKALTLTVPSDPGLATTNYFKLISNASNATSRIYSSNHTFTKFENKFLDKFEINPHKIIEHFFSKSSKNYLLKFDKNLNFDNFKVGNDINKFRENLKNGTLFENKELISTFINDFNRYGFDKGGADPQGQNESFVADTINFNFNSSMENVDSNPVRVSKLEISEWFINAWKYETFLGFLQNTVVLKLTKTIGDCDWLIVTSDDKVSTNNRYLTPPSSANDVIDNVKEKELNGGTSTAKKELLPALNPKGKGCGLLGGKKETQVDDDESPVPRHTKRSSPKKSDLKKISHPSPPRDISHFENAASGRPSLDHSPRTAGKKSIEKQNDSLDQAKSLEQPLQVTKQPISKPSSPKLPSLVDAVIDTPDSNESFKSESKISVASKELKESPVVKHSPVVNSSTSASPDKPLPIEKPSVASSSSSPVQPPVLPKQKIATPPQQVSKTLNIPPPVLKDEQNTNSLDSTNAKQLGEVELPKVLLPRPLQSPKNYDVPKSPVGSPMRFKKGSSPNAHPYLQLQHQSPQKQPRAPVSRPQQLPQEPQLGNKNKYSTPPTRTVERFEPSPSPHFNFTKPLHSPTSPNVPFSPNSSNRSLDRPKRFSKLAVATGNVQSSIKNFSPSSSPITQALPKFFKKGSSDQLSNLPSSGSSGSLSHINDGSGTDGNNSSRKSALLMNNPELEVVNIETIPEIPYTPKALREAQFSGSSADLGSSRERSSSTINSKDDKEKEKKSKELDDCNTTDFNKLLSENRESFMGDHYSSANTSANSEKSLPELIESNEGDDTQDTTKTQHEHLKIEQNLDGLLEEIKESLDSSEKFFSTDDLTENKRSSTINV